MSTRLQRAQYVARELDALYAEAGPPLQYTDPFRLLIAVLLSAQCTDRRVNEVAPRLFRRARTPAGMVRLGLPALRETIRPCGLFESKSRAILALSEKLLQEFGGQVPASFEALESLPGIGHKSASVVMAQAFGQPAFPVDTHVHRLAARWGLSSGKNVSQTEKDLKKLYPPALWHRRHLQMIFYGREYCTARGCDGAVCPMCRALRRLQ